MAAESPGLDTIFCAAVEIASAEDRAAYIARACGDDHALRDSVARLVSAHFQAGNFLESPAPAPTATVDDPITERPGTVIGPYKLLEQIGEGGFGVVFMAEQQRVVRRKVALKVLKPGMDTRQVIARFEAERQALALMDHPNIAHVFDGGETPAGRPYFVMELVKGVPITDFCDQGRLTPRERLGLFVDVCQAVQHAHQKGIIHRDLKPSNVLVTLHDGTPVVKVIDFGIAKAAGQQLTEKTLFTNFAQLIGTPLYMSPEQAALSGLDVDTRSDIYSLGVLLYELLTGTTPFTRERFQAAGYDEMRRILREEEPPRPSTRLSTTQELPAIAANRGLEPRKLSGLVRGDLDWIIMKCLEKDRRRRYETANVLAMDVQRYLADEPVLAGPPSARYRLRKFVRRNKSTVVAAALVLGALLSAVVGTTLGLVQARLERDEKEKARQQAENAREDAAAKAVAEREARRARERTLTDMYTAFGLAAGARDDPRQAVLWFAHAARLAGDDRERAEANRTRAAAWGRLAVRPVRAFLHPAEWVENNLAFHPGGGHLLTHGFDPATEETTCRLWDLEREAALPFPGNPGLVSAAAWDARGERLAVGTPQGKLTICRFPGGEVLQRVPFASPIARVVFSPGGRYCAVAAANHVRVWDCRQAAFATPDLEHPEPVETLAFHPHDELLATGCKDRFCRVFAVPAESNNPLFTPVPHVWGAMFRFLSHTPIPPVFFAQGRELLTVRQGEVSCRDSRTGRVLRVLPFGEADKGNQAKVAARIDALALSGDGRHAAVTGWFSDGTRVRIYDVASAQAVSPYLDHRGGGQAAFSAAFSPDGQTLLTGCSDHTARLWAVPGGKPLGSPLTHPMTVSAGAFAPDGRHLATAQRGGLIRLWALPAGNPRDYRAAVGAWSHVRLSRDGRFLLPKGLSQFSCELRGTHVVDLASGRRVGKPLEANGFLMDAAFSPDGLQVAAAVSLAGSSAERRAHPGQRCPGQLQLWDWRAGKLQHKPLPLPAEPRGLDYGPDGRQLAVLGADGELVLIDPAAGKVLRSWRAHGPYWINQNPASNGSVRFSPDGRGLLTFGTDTNSVRVWDAVGGQLRHELKHDGKCYDVQFSPDGRLVATAALDNRVRVWELETGERLAELVHPDWTYTAPFSPDGKYLLTACRDHMARLWDWQAGRLVCPPFEHEHEANVVAFLPDGRNVLSLGMDKTLRIWEWHTGKPVCPPLALGGSGQNLAVTPDGHRVVCGGKMNALPVFHLDDWLAPPTLGQDDLCLWGEVLSGQRIEAGGGVTNLTAEAWLERWRNFRRRHPERVSSP
jgi:WD40 repeat protein/serine/threonine protein kinase